jgi:hypothetical protein
MKFKNYKFIISPSTRINKKFMVVISNHKFKKTIHFGQKGFSDYTIHKDYDRMLRYSKRHEKNEDWDNILTAGFWAKWVLWNKPSFRDSIKDIESRKNIKIYIKKGI